MMSIVPEARPDIAIFLPSLEGGGAERVMSILANGFASRGYNVDLVLASATGPYLTKVDARVRLVDLGGMSIARSAWPFIRYLRERQPRTILTAMSHANVVAGFASLLARSKARLVMSERLSLAAALEHSRGVRDRIVQFLMRPAYRRADAVVVVAKAMIDEMEQFLGIPRTKLICVYNPVVDDELVAQAAQANDHPWLVENTEVPVVLGCGRLEPQKDFRTLIEAFSIVRKQRAARLLILGEGAERHALNDTINRLELAEDVDMPGFAENPFSFMRHSAVFVLSSIYEGMPGVLIQAMACGAPVVSTDCPTGPDEILEDGRWGKLVPIRNPNAMARAILATLESPVPADERAMAFAHDNAVTHYLSALGLPSHAPMH